MTFLTVRDIRARLQISRGLAYEILQQLPRVKVGSVLRVSETDFNSWVVERTVQPCKSSQSNSKAGSETESTTAGNGWLWLQHNGERVSLKTKDPAQAIKNAEEHKRPTSDPSHVAAGLKTIADACAAFRTYAKTGENRDKPPSPDTFEMYECTSDTSAESSSRHDRWIKSTRRPSTTTSQPAAASTSARRKGRPQARLREHSGQGARNAAANPAPRAPARLVHLPWSGCCRPQAAPATCR
jgi:hypothetical protein